MVTLLMISISEPNQACVRAWLKRMRIAISTGGVAPQTLDEFVDFTHHDLLDVAAAGERLAHARGVHIELDGGCASGQHVALEVGRDIE